jgi:anti-sigma regulatory factor (Ser/Thr protein kinase)
VVAVDAAVYEGRCTTAESRKRRGGVCVPEIVMNAMEQRGKFDSEQFVEVCYLKSKRQVMCRVKDTGTGFSPQEALKEARLKSVKELGAIQMWGENESVPPGLGILMAEKFVDELICSEKGNEIFLIRYLPKVENEKL